MSDPPASIPEHWNMCKTARNFRAAVWGSSGSIDESELDVGDSSMPIRRIVQRKDGSTSEGQW